MEEQLKKVGFLISKTTGTMTVFRVSSFSQYNPDQDEGIPDNMVGAGGGSTRNV